MKLGSKLLSVWLLSSIALASISHAQDGGGGMGDAGTAITRTHTSVLVLGDTSEAPLDEGSLNALFTPTFLAEAGSRLTEKLSPNADVDLNPAIASFQYVSVGKGNNNTRVAQINVGFQDPPEELIPKLSIEGPKTVLELLEKHVLNYLTARRDLTTSRLQERRDHLTARIAELEQRIAQLENDLQQQATLTRTPDLSQYYSQLEKRQREDHLKRLGLSAERQAVEKQVEQLRAQMESMKSSTPLLEELKRNVEARMKMLEDLKQAAKEGSADVKRLELDVAEAERMLKKVSEAEQGGAAAVSEVEAMKAKLLDARARMEYAKAMVGERTKQAEAEAVAGKIEFLRKKEEMAQSQYGARLQALNEMLSQSAIESDASAARQEAIVVELQKVAEEIRQHSATEISRNNRERELNLLRTQQEALQRELFQLELQMENVPTQEFTILPWGG
jgi:hypothetical protein